MNSLEVGILKWLEDDSMMIQSENQLKASPDHVYTVNNIPVKLDDSIELFNHIKELISQAISTQLFKSLPTPQQQTIYNQVQAIYKHKANVNQVIIQVQSLYNVIFVAGIDKKLDSYDNYKRALTDIANLRRSYSHLTSGLDKMTEKIDIIHQNYNRSNELIKSLSANKGQIDQSLKEAEQNLNSSAKIYSEIDKHQQEIQNAKKEIIAFKSNIDSFKSDIEEQSNGSNKIISDFEEQRDDVNQLIDDAEKALQLKSSQGISAALSKQYDAENKLIKRVYWIVAAFIFLLFALLGIMLLLFNIQFEHFKIVSDGVNSIVARVVFVGISITGATFCANQYTRQKHIADDYGYKLVLAKSILAFTKEIKKHSPDEVTTYMKDVLEEINKSPVHKFKDEGITRKDVGLLQQIADVIMKNK